MKRGIVILISVALLAGMTALVVLARNGEQPGGGNALANSQSGERVTADKFIHTTRFRVKPGKTEEMVSQIRAQTPTIRANPSCLGYDAHQNAEDPAQFMVYETFSSRAEYDRHMGRAETKAFLSRVRPMMAEGSVEAAGWTLVYKGAD